MLAPLPDAIAPRPTSLTGALDLLAAAQGRAALGHAVRTAEVAVALATELGWPPERTRRLRRAALVHDIGKALLPPGLADSPEPLGRGEFSLVREHAALGAELLQEVLSPEQAAWVRGHHERFDGRGYPDGLLGMEIPEGARIIAIADAWDVMVHGRAYRPRLTVAEAVGECWREAGRQFAPDAVRALARIRGALGAAV
jgi:putative nucleotidyltransferase with HDIG domain